MTIEFPLIMVLAVGLITVASEPVIGVLIGFVGGIAPLVFGTMQKRSSIGRIQGNPYEDETGQLPLG